MEFLGRISVLGTQPELRNLFVQYRPDAMRELGFAWSNRPAGTWTGSIDISTRSESVALPILPYAVMRTICSISFAGGRPARKTIPESAATASDAGSSAALAVRNL